MILFTIYNHSEHSALNNQKTIAYLIIALAILIMVIALLPETFISARLGDLYIILLSSIIIGSQLSQITNKKQRLYNVMKKDIEDEILDLIHHPIEAAIERKIIAEPLQQDLSSLEDIRNAIKNDGVEVLLQPVVSLPQQKPRYYECFSRIVTKGGIKLEPIDYMNIAEETGIISAIDNLLLFKCIQMVKRIKNADGYVGFFCNISERTLADNDFITRLLKFFEINPQLRPWIFFEIKENVAYSLDPDVKNNLKKFIDAKCHISLDQLETLNLDTNWLKSMGVRFIKVNKNALNLENLTSLEKIFCIRQTLKNMKIDVIVAKVEQESELKKALQFNIDFGQGYLFGKPMVSKF